MYIHREEAPYLPALPGWTQLCAKGINIHHSSINHIDMHQITSVLQDETCCSMQVGSMFTADSEELKIPYNAHLMQRL